MRRAQSVRYSGRSSMASGAGLVDDLGVLREAEDTEEDTLRRRLLEKERECDRLMMSNENYKAQLEQRPPLEAYQKIQREHKNLELLLQGTMRENEKCMVDLERSKAREKLLERELTRLAGDNWQVNLEIPPASSIRPSSVLHQRSHTISSPVSPMGSSTRNYSPTPQLLQDGSGSSTSDSPKPWDQDGSDQRAKIEREAKRQAQIEEIRMMVVGLDQRLDAQTARLRKYVARTKEEGDAFDLKVAQAKSMEWWP